jgi:uncharacterized protein YyaL (SSP411 family)
VANRLANEASPYLRQHADNPVDWYPWGDEAFARARSDDRPLLISIGYAACHWCHVMAHESFEDPGVAAVMNESFVCVKVDREERPDVDAVYMEATQAMTGSGGWPMTVFATPDGEPFYCGTYFPPLATQGRPGFVDICRAVDETWHNKRGDLVEQARKLTDHVRSSTLPAGDEVPDETALTDAIQRLVAAHDTTNGGFGGAPKFPQASSIDMLLRGAARTGDRAARQAALLSLDAMASGGIYDHLGGGFARYSVDARWLVPHFEKMLYDQALLARAYLHAWQLTGERRFRQVLEETVTYVRRDLEQSGGGVASSEDADSEGVEGKFYVWTPAEVLGALDGDEHLAAEATAFWGVTEGGNFEGRNILNRIAHRADLTRPPHIEAARQRLFAAREKRVRPGLDDKVLTEWNALWVSTLAEAAAATGRPDWLGAAEQTGEFLLASLRRADGRWLRSWQASHGAQHLALAADHAALVDAFTRLAEASGHARWIGEARTAADALLDLFWDQDGGGLFTTGHDGEQLVARQKDQLDNASPSAASLAAVALQRLAALTGEDRYRRHAGQILAQLGTLAVAHPTAFGHLLTGLDLWLAGITEVVMPGDTPALREAFAGAWRPDAVLAWGERYDSPLWEARSEGLAYVCRNFACAAPTSDPTELGRQLAA